MEGFFQNLGPTFWGLFGQLTGSNWVEFRWIWASQFQARFFGPISWWGFSLPLFCAEVLSFPGVSKRPKCLGHGFWGTNGFWSTFVGRFYKGGVFFYPGSYKFFPQRGGGNFFLTTVPMWGRGVFQIIGALNSLFSPVYKFGRFRVTPLGGFGPPCFFGRTLVGVIGEKILMLHTCCGRT